MCIRVNPCPIKKCPVVNWYAEMDLISKCIKLAHPQREETGPWNLSNLIQSGESVSAPTQLSSYRPQPLAAWDWLGWSKEIGSENVSEPICMMSLERVNPVAPVDDCCKSQFFQGIVTTGWWLRQNTLRRSLFPVRKDGINVLRRDTYASRSAHINSRSQSSLRCGQVFSIVSFRYRRDVENAKDPVKPRLKVR